MPGRKKGIRLWLRAKRRDRNGTVRQATWIILDGNKHIATGCAESEIAAAEAKLAEYVAAKYRPPRKARDIEQIDIADVLSVYEEDFRDRQANRTKFNGRLQRLNDFWGDRKLADITGQSCRDYVAARGSNGGARRDLEDLRAAINHHAKEGFHRGWSGFRYRREARRARDGSLARKPPTSFVCAGAPRRCKPSIGAPLRVWRCKLRSDRCAIWHGLS